MNLRRPAIRLRANGDYLVRWAGRDYYLSRDAAVAKALFEDPKSTHPGALHRWKEWSRTRTRGRHGARDILLVDAAAEMFRHYISTDRPATARSFRDAAARFMRVHGEAGLIELASADPRKGRYTAPVLPLLNAFVADLARAPVKKRLKNKTINHQVGAVKRLFNWAAEQGMCPSVAWTGVKRLPTRRGTPEPVEIEELARMISHAGTPHPSPHMLPSPDDSKSERPTDPDLVPWLALNYLLVARPSEIVTLVHDFASIKVRNAPIRKQDGAAGRVALIQPQQPLPQRSPQPSARAASGFLPIRDAKGRTILPTGLFKLSAHKSSWRGESGADRLLIITDEAMAWLRIARPKWSRLDSYSSAAVAAGFSGGPHILRDSAATHLRARGVELADVELLLGHRPPGEWKSYAQEPWRDLHRKAGRISLKSGLVHGLSVEFWGSEIAKLGPLKKARKNRRRQEQPETLPAEE